MKRLDFEMPPFTRLQWVSKEVKDKYEPLLHEAKRAAGILEKLATINGIKKVCTDNIFSDLDVYYRDLELMNLKSQKIRNVSNYSGMSNHDYTSDSEENSHSYICVGKEESDIEEFIKASLENDVLKEGKLLGYPDSSSLFLEKINRENICDPVWLQAENCHEDSVRMKEERFIKLKNIDWKMNPLLKTQKLFVSFHFPESLDCEESLNLCNQLFELGKADNARGLAELEMFLRMPMEWSALKGIAYIKTPLFKLSTNSLTCIEKYTVQIEGTYFPELAPSSTEFPWNDSWSTIARNGNKLELGGNLIE